MSRDMFTGHVTINYSWCVRVVTMTLCMVGSSTERELDRVSRL